MCLRVDYNGNIQEKGKLWLNCEKRINNGVYRFIRLSSTSKNNVVIPPRLLVITVDNTTMNQSFISKNFVVDFLELTDNKTYLVLNIFEFFSTKLIHCSFRYLLWTIKRHLRINSKNGYQIMDSLLSIFSKYWTTFKFPDIAFKINLFQNLI